MKSGAKFFYCLKCTEIFEDDHEVCKKKVLKLQNLPGGGGILGFWNGGADVLIWGLQFWGGEIIWGLKFQGLKCPICGLKFGVGEIIWV